MHTPTHLRNFNDFFGGDFLISINLCVDIFLFRITCDVLEMFVSLRSSAMVVVRRTRLEVVVFSSFLTGSYASVIRDSSVV